MPFHQGKFRTHPGQVRSTGEKTPPVSSPQEKAHGPAQAAHGGGSVEHITKTEPGKTQPHPTTGVHAFHANHTGGGKYESHTHHDGGEVETRQHPNAAERDNAMNEALPDDQGQQDTGGGNDMAGGQDFAESLGGIGGEST